MTDRPAIDPNPGLVDRLAELLFPWLGPEAAARSGQPAAVIGPRGAEPAIEIELGL